MCAALLLLAQATAMAKESVLYSVELIDTLSPQAIEREVGALFGDLPAPEAVNPVDCYLIRFESSYADGEPAMITAQLFLPRVSSAFLSRVSTAQKKRLVLHHSLTCQLSPVRHRLIGSRCHHYHPLLKGDGLKIR